MPDSTQGSRTRPAPATRVDGAEADGVGSGTGPLKDLLAFHAEIRAALTALLGFIADARRGVIDESDATFLARFFSGPLLWHDEDEEVSVLRRLRHAPLSAAQLALVEATHRGHDKMETLLESVVPVLEKLARKRTDVSLTDLEQEARALRSLLEGHLTLEEQNLFPLAAQVFTAEDLACVRKEIDARHGRSSPDATRSKRAVPL